MTDFNWVDYVIIGIFVISCLMGLMRGVIREIISLLTWIAAAVVASLFATQLAAAFTSSSKVQSAVSSASTSMGINATQQVSLLSIGISFIVLFCITLLIGSIINYFISRAVAAPGLSITNHIFGGIFGLARGFVINVVLIFLVQLTPLSQELAWTSSRLVATMQPTVIWLSNIIQPGLQSLKARMGQTLQNVGTPSF